MMMARFVNRPPGAPICQSCNNASFMFRVAKPLGHGMSIWKDKCILPDPGKRYEHYLL